MKKPALKYIAIELLTKVFNPRSQRSETSNTDLESIKTDGLKTALEVSPLDSDVWKDGEKVEVLAGHRRTAFLLEWFDADPLGFLNGFSIVDGKKVSLAKGIPCYLHEGLTVEEKEDVRNDHSTVRNLEASEFIASLVREVSAGITKENTSTEEKAKETWRSRQVKLIRKHWNNFLLFSQGVDKAAIREYEETLKAECPLRKPASYDSDIAVKKAHDKRVSDWQVTNAAKAEKQLEDLSRGFFQKIQRLVELPSVVFGIFLAKLNGMETNDEIIAYLAQNGLELPAFAGDSIPDVSGKRLTGSPKVINALHKAFLEDGRSMGDSFEKAWKDAANVKPKEKNGDKQSKTMIGSQLKEFNESLQSLGMRSTIRKVRGLEPNVEAIRKADAVLYGLDKVEEKGNKTVSALLAENPSLAELTVSAFLLHFGKTEKPATS